MILIIVTIVLAVLGIAMAVYGFVDRERDRISSARHRSPDDENKDL